MTPPDIEAHVLSGRRQVKPCYYRLAPLLAYFALAPAHAQYADQPVYFTEPLSGQRASEYAIELATTTQGRHEFVVPRDCAELEQILHDGQADRGRVIDRRLWHKVREDCWFHQLLTRHNGSAIQDHVSTYDFMNARIEDLPIGTDCNPSVDDDCGRHGGNRHGIIPYFPFALPPGDHTADLPQAECALRDGLFYGQLYALPDGIRCDGGDGQPSLRLIAVDLADINGDGFLDAVLRFIPLGPGAARAPLILPLTRTSDDEPFRAPDLSPAPLN
ncbi:MAG: hypothetical protein KDJ27_18655 [Gammaproteobacteria bacterium]|nr:hypothetical protein [Gammaproteobacteria bacterium]